MRVKTGAQLAEAFAAIPAYITSLNLSENALGTMEPEKLIRALSAIHAHVTSLNLAGNGLSEGISNEELRGILRRIPGSVTSLNLSNNNLCAGGYRAMGIILSGIRRSVVSLDLSQNPPSVLSAFLGVYYLSTYAMFDVSSSVTSLCLREISLGDKPIHVIVTAFNKLPRQLSKSNNEIADLQFINEVFKFMPKIGS